MKKIILFGIFLISISSYLGSKELATPSEVFDNINGSQQKDNYFYFNLPDNPYVFDTLTYIISNNNEDAKLVKITHEYAKLLGEKNGATIVNYTFNERYIKLMKKVNCLGKVDPNNVPSVLFYIKESNSCHVLSYKNMNIFNGILIDLYNIIQKAKNSSELNSLYYKELLHKTIEEEAKRNKLSTTIVESIKEFINVVYNKTTSKK